MIVKFDVRLLLKDDETYQNRGEKSLHGKCIVGYVVLFLDLVERECYFARKR